MKSGFEKLGTSVAAMSVIYTEEIHFRPIRARVLRRLFHGKNDGDAVLVILSNGSLEGAGSESSNFIEAFRRATGRFVANKLFA